MADRWVSTLNLEVDTLRQSISTAQEDLVAVREEHRSVMAVIERHHEERDRQQREIYRKAALNEEQTLRKAEERDALRSEVAVLSEDHARTIETIAELEKVVEGLQRETFEEHTRHGEAVWRLYRDHDRAMKFAREDNAMLVNLRADVQRLSYS